MHSSSYYMWVSVVGFRWRASWFMLLSRVRKTDNASEMPTFCWREMERVTSPLHQCPQTSIRPLHTQDWEPMTITLQALPLVEKAEPVQVRFPLRLRDQQSKMWMQDGCKVYMDSYMASNGSCFMVTLTLFKNHLLKVGLTQNREAMALRTLTTVGLFYFTMCECPRE